VAGANYSHAEGAVPTALVVYHGDNQVTRTDEAGRFTFPPEVEPFCLVVVYQDGIALLTEKELAQSADVQNEPWTADNQRLQIIRRPAPGQHVDFPKGK
jgi:hypothetical protein